MRAWIVIGLLVLSTAAAAQSPEDKKTSLKGLVRVAFKEVGVERLGGGTLGSPFLTQVQKPFTAAGGSVAELDGAAERGIPVYELLCTAMDWSDGSVRVACSSRLLRQVWLSPPGQDQPAPSVYAATWSSKTIIASFPDFGAAQYGLDKVTVQLGDQFVADWSAANPDLKPAAAPKKKKG